MSINDELYDAIVFGERDTVVEIVQKSVDAGDNVVELLNTPMMGITTVPIEATVAGNRLTILNHAHWPKIMGTRMP